MKIGWMSLFMCIIYLLHGYACVCISMYMLRTQSEINTTNMKEIEKKEINTTLL